MISEKLISNAEEKKNLGRKMIRAVHAWRWILLFVVLPTVIAAIYYGFLAADVYVSESRFVVKNPNQRQASTSTLANLIQTTGLSTGQEQTNEVIDYIRSRDALRDAQKHLDVHAIFASSSADALSGYPRPFDKDRFENLFTFYSKHIDAHLDHDTGVAVLSVKAFSAREAHDLNARLLDLSEQLVNTLNDRAQHKAIAEAERRMLAAQARVLRARLALREYRNTEDLLDPAKQATGVLELSNRLVAEQAALRAQLELMQRTTPSNPAIPSLRTRIQAIGAQVAAQNSRVVGTSTGIASKLGGYENLFAEQEFSTQMLAATNASLEQARSEALRQQFYLERVVEPNKPDESTLPHRLKRILTVFAASVCLYFIGWMLVVGILEHAPED